MIPRGNRYIDHPPTAQDFEDARWVPILIDQTTGKAYCLREDGEVAEIGGSASQAYPVGAVFLSIVNTDPAQLLGYGTWTQIAGGRALFGQTDSDPDFDTAEETGGAKTSAALLAHSHTVDDAGHNHTQNAHTHVQDAHTHTQNAHTHVQDSHNHTQNSFAPRIINSGTAGTVGVQGASAASNANASNAATTATNQAATATNQNATAVNQNATAVNQNATATNNSATTGVTVNSAGSGSSFSLMNPYFVLYVWRRDA